MDPGAQGKLLEKVSGIVDAIFLATALLSLAAWIYCIYYYVWTGSRQFSSAWDIVLFLCLPPTLLILATAALKLHPAAKLSAALLWSSTVASIYIFELLLTLPWLGSTTGAATTKDQRRQAAAKQGIVFDSRDVVEVVLDARAHGMDAVPAVYPGALLEEQPGGAAKSVIGVDGKEVLPLAGVSNKLSVLCNENGDYTVYRSDEYGFHNPPGLWASDRVDVAVIGDSFVHGFCVPSEKHFVSLIRRRYPLTLSLGMGGNGPLLELAALQEFLPALKPKIVLWAYFEKNDLIELREETKSPLLLQYLRTGFRQNLIALQPQIDQALLAYIEKEKARALLRLREQKRSRFAKRLAEVAKLSQLRSRLGLASGQQHTAQKSPSGFASAEMALFRAILQRAKSSVESWGGSLYFVYLPPWERYAAPRSAEQNREEVFRMVESLKIPIIDIDKAFQEHGDPVSLFPFRLSGHYNIEGNQVVADAVLARLDHVGASQRNTEMHR